MPEVLELSVELQLDRHSIVPEVRAWIDLKPDGSLDSETELVLHRCARWRWIGLFEIEAARSTHFFYRLGLIADDGAQLSLAVRHRALGRDILVDGDTLVGPKSWLIGDCLIDSSESRHAETRPSLGGPSTNLILLAQHRIARARSF